jgi:hypothetical protein
MWKCRTTHNVVDRTHVNMKMYISYANSSAFYKKINGYMGCSAKSGLSPKVPQYNKEPPRRMQQLTLSFPGNRLFISISIIFVMYIFL